MRETTPTAGCETLTLELEGITAGDYLTWVRDPEPQALGVGLRSIEIEAEPMGSTILATLEWATDPPAPAQAASAAGLPVIADVRAVFATRCVVGHLPALAA